MGTPVICSDIVENRAILRDDTLYFQSGDAADLADRISWALEHPEQASVLAQRAKEWVNTHLAWSSIVSSYEQLYERCVRGDALPDLAEEWLV